MGTKVDPSQDERFMRRALKLAERGIGSTHPNPRVGAVVVADGETLGEGWHQKPGEPHAEAMALEKAGARARGATLYVTLEPCAEHGRTPPCTDAILRAGIWRVVYASSDPNPKMAGGGELLRLRDVEVQAGVLKNKADELNQPFFHYFNHHRPYVIAKASISLDGKLATHREHSQWISGDESRKHAHRLRAVSDAIIVGDGTLACDNPALTVRDVKTQGEPPLRTVMCFGTPEFKADYKIADGQAPARLYVRSPNEHSPKWEEAGVEVVRVTSLMQALQHLADDGRLALLVEGGGMLHAAFFEARLTDELVLYQAPILIGGKDATSLWHGLGVEKLSDSPSLTDIERRKLGNDQLIRGRVAYPG